MTMTSAHLAAELQRFARQISELQSRITQQERGTNAATLSNASIEGGALIVKDDDGNPQIILGQQADGTFAHAAVNAAEPPAPSRPVADAAVEGLVAAWDGTMADGTPPLADFAGVQIHCSPDPFFTPSVLTLKSTMIGPAARPVAGLAPGIAYTVVLVTINQAGALSEPSAPVTVTPIGVADAIPPSSITADMLAAGLVVAGIVDATTINAPLLLGSTILGYATLPRRGPRYESFEGTTAGFLGSNAGCGQDTSVFATTGSASLRITASSAGPFYAFSPVRPVQPGDPVTVAADVFTSAALGQAYVGIIWEDASHGVISETDCPDYALGSGGTANLSVSDSAPAAAFGASADAAWYRVAIGDHAGGGAGALLYADSLRESGNMVFAASPAGGTDTYGNVYDQGIEIDGQPGMGSAFTVQDAFGQDVVAAIDGQGNYSGLGATFDTVNVGGMDLIGDLLPPLPQGITAYGHPAEYPTGHYGTTEGTVFEMDCDVMGGRAYRVTFAELSAETQAAGQRGFLRVRYTIDGSRPDTSSGVLWLYYIETGATNFLRPPPFSGLFFPPADCTARMLVTCAARDSSPAYIQIDDGYLYVEDTGFSPGNNYSWLGSAGSGGTSGTPAPSPKKYTRTYGLLHSYCYQGSDGTNSNLKINTDGHCTQGGDRPHTYNGRAKTFYLMPSGIAGDLAGSSISKTEIYLNNNHSWYGTGLTASIGWSTDTSFGSTKGDPTAHDAISTAHFNQGQAKWITVSNSIAAAFRDSGARCVTLFRDSNSLSYYGFFSSASMKMRVTYTK